MGVKHAKILAAAGRQCCLPPLSGAGDKGGSVVIDAVSSSVELSITECMPFTFPSSGSMARASELMRTFQ